MSVAIHMWRVGNPISLDKGYAVAWSTAASAAGNQNVCEQCKRRKKKVAYSYEHAMNMGADDPTKPDYSKYMPKKKN